MEKQISIAKICYCSTFDCDVEILSRGHFPETAMVKLSNGLRVEVYLSSLRQYN